MPFSPTLLLEPTPAYRRPSRLATRLLVQWWLIGPPGRSATFAGVAVIARGSTLSLGLIFLGVLGGVGVGE